MSDVIKVVVDSSHQIQWLVFNDEIINAHNIVDISFSSDSLILCYVNGETNHMEVTNPEKTFRALQEMVAGKQKENT